ncbi:MAG: alpha/beta fold hydrolase BchO [Pseudomonadota bacterium]
MEVIAALDWDEHGRDWPHRAHSTFVEHRGTRYHIQSGGQGPQVLLLHGTGAATHSWRDLWKPLTSRFHVIALDLPGHGFSGRRAGEALSLATMGREIAGVLTELGAKPDVIVAHSAGAAIAAQLVLAHGVSPHNIVTFNAALLPFPGLAGWLFPSLARAMFSNDFAASFFASQATRRDAVERLLTNTGSKIGPDGIRLYQRLFTAKSHVGGTLDMMANWDLDALAQRLRRLKTPVHLVVTGGDKAIPPERGLAAADHMPNAATEFDRALGHLAHEESPGWAAGIISRVYDESHA